MQEAGKLTQAWDVYLSLFSHIEYCFLCGYLLFVFFNNSMQEASKLTQALAVYLSYVLTLNCFSLWIFSICFP